MCLEHARLNQQPGRALDLSTARFGQQLSLADMVGQRRKTQRIDVDLRKIDRTPPRVTWRQEVLFEFPHDIELLTNAARNVAPDIVDYCKNIVADHSASHGWSRRQTNDVIRSLRLLYLVQDSPLSRVKATEVLRLHKYNGNVVSTLDVLAAADLLIDDRVSRIDQYFAGKTAGLPETILAQLQTWLDIRLNGRSTAPRLHSRLPQTVRIQIAHLAPIVQAWADQGYTSLAEVTAADLRNALPPSGAQRSFAEQATRSLFSILKTEKLIFANPARGQRLTQREHNIPLPLNTEPIVEALNSPYPGVALVVALAAFHALTNKQIRELQLTDIADGRLSIGDRNIPLATPVRVRLQAWLEHRACTWPSTLNPYLLVSKKTGPRLIPVSNGYAWRQVHLAAQALREDRIVQEINATSGDVRRLCDLFGMSVESAMRYTLTLAGGQAEPPIRVPRTRTIQ